MVPALQVLCFFGLIRSIGATMGPLFYAVGKPKILTKATAMHLIILALLIYPLTVKYGILGTSIATVLPMLPLNIWQGYKLASIVKDTFFNIYRVLLLPVVASLMMVIFLFIVKEYIFTSINLNRLVVLIIMGIFIYSLIVMSNKSYFRSLKALLSLSEVA